MNKLLTSCARDLNAPFQFKTIYMNIESLKIATSSIIESGNRIRNGNFDAMFLREFIDSYNKTKDYLKSDSNYNPKLAIYSNQLPDIEYKTFRNPFFLLKFILTEKVKLRYRSSGGGALIDFFPDIDSYPARTKYMTNLNLKIIEINRILVELRSNL